MAGSDRRGPGKQGIFSDVVKGQVKLCEGVTATVPIELSALPPAVDLEFGGNSSSRPSAAAFQAELDIFMGRLRRAYGKEPVVYTDEAFYTQYLTNYPIRRLWIASLLTAPRPPFAHSWLFWQFAERGRIRGIETLVDLDVFAKDEPTFRALCK